MPGLLACCCWRGPLHHGLSRRSRTEHGKQRKRKLVDPTGALCGAACVVLNVEHRFNWIVDGLRVATIRVPVQDARKGGPRSHKALARAAPYNTPVHSQGRTVHAAWDAAGSTERRRGAVRASRAALTPCRQPPQSASFHTAHSEGSSTSHTALVGSQQHTCACKAQSANHWLHPATASIVLLSKRPPRPLIAQGNRSPVQAGPLASARIRRAGCSRWVGGHGSTVVRARTLPLPLMHPELCQGCKPPRAHLLPSSRLRSCRCCSRSSPARMASRGAAGSRGTAAFRPFQRPARGAEGGGRLCPGACMHAKACCKGRGSSAAMVQGVHVPMGMAK